MATPSNEDIKAVLSEYDALEEKYEVDAMYELITKHKDSTDPEILWRLASATLEKGRKMGNDDKKKSVFAAFEHIKRAVDIDENNHHVLMWFCILLSEVSNYEGIKTKIENAYKCKEYMLRGLELQPNFAPLKHCLGVWCFEVSGLSWVERQAASLIYAKPPTSSYEEALSHFEDAEKTEPGFYMANNVMTAKTLIKLKRDKERAKQLLIKTYEAKPRSFDDHEARQDAKKLLQKEFSTKV